MNVLRGVRQRLIPLHGDHNPDRAALLCLEFKTFKTGILSIFPPKSPKLVRKQNASSQRHKFKSSHLVLVLVGADGGGVGQYDVVRRDVGLPVRVAAVAVAERRGAVVGRVRAQHVLELGEQVGLVERRPELDPVAELPEAHVRVVLELLPEFHHQVRLSVPLKTWHQEPKPAERERERGSEVYCTGFRSPASQRIGLQARGAGRNGAVSRMAVSLIVTEKKRSSNRRA